MKYTKASHSPRATAPTCRGHASSRPAFTLVELLIVIAIIGILVALVASGGAEVLAIVRAVQCRNNLKELDLCFKQYSLEHGGVFPPMRSTGRNDDLLKTMADEARLTAADPKDAKMVGYHWSLFLWPYHHSLALYTCPCDPNADRRGDVTGAGLKTGSPFTDAPPESYGLNTLLFRSTPDLRKLAGASWGLKGSEFASELTFTNRSEQQQQFPQLARRILLFCGTAGCSVGHPSNTAWRDTGLPGIGRFEWHGTGDAGGAFEDAPGRGSNYLFFDGHAEYREETPSRFEWAMDLKDQ